MRTRGRAHRGLPSYANRVRPDLLMTLVDALLVTLSYALVLLLRYDGAVPSDVWTDGLTFLPVAVLVFVVCNWLFGLYAQVWRFASIHEARRLIASGLTATVFLAALVWIGPRLIPLSVALGGGVLTTGMLGATRYQSRLFSRRRLEVERHGLRVLIVGAGSTGAGLARQMLTSEGAGLIPVAYVDDDPHLLGKRILGVPVVGGVDDVAAVAEQYEANQVIIAVPSASGSLVRSVTDQVDALGVAVRTVPGLDDIVRSGLRLQDVRQVQIEDLLGREQVETDLEAIRAMLRGRRVLITGAGGSIGSEIARQVAAAQPASLLLLDHDETHLHDVSTVLRAPHTNLLADIRDRDRIVRLFDRYRPEIVFHAAAHKHVPMLETNPSEAVRTNISGTSNLIEASRRLDVEAFVLISTDKAVRPSSVMGASKKLAEFLVVDTARATGRRYTSVRFGNVLGSRGSVIPTFVRQIEAGGPVTVTDARMTRYFMSIPEAVQLVLQAAATSRGGEIFMLDMGQPVSVLELARRMVRLSGRRVGTDIEIRVIGTRPGEKLHEELNVPDEDPSPTTHPSVHRLTPVDFPSYALSASLTTLRRYAAVDDDDAVRALMLSLAHDPTAVDPTSPEYRQMTIDLTQKDTWSPSTS